MIDTLLLVTCPSCASLFRMKREELHDDGRIVRCIQCETMWNIDAEGNNGAIIDDDPVFIPSPPISPQLQPTFVEKPKKQVPLLYVMIALVMTACLGLYIGRESVLKTYPQTGGFYKSFGFSLGLEFREVTAKRVLENDIDTLVISGKIGNMSNTSQKTSDIALSLRDKTKKTVHSWGHTPSKTTLLAGEEIAFETKFITPIIAGSDITVRFSP